jgi:hypothetical protein
MQHGHRQGVVDIIAHVGIENNVVHMDASCCWWMAL